MICQIDRKGGFFTHRVWYQDFILIFGALSSFGKARAHDTTAKKMCRDVTQVIHILVYFCVAICKFGMFFILVDPRQSVQSWWVLFLRSIFEILKLSLAKVIETVYKSSTYLYLNNHKILRIFLNQSILQVIGLSRTKNYRSLWVSGFLDLSNSRSHQ